MTDPSYAGQVVTFTFPHIGNTGVNTEDDETADPVAEGLVVKWDPTEPSNWRALENLSDWLARRGRVGIGGVDTTMARNATFCGALPASAATSPFCRPLQLPRMFWRLNPMVCFCQTARATRRRRAPMRCR